MKLQVLNGSFGKVLAAAATIAFMVSLTSPVHAQQGQWGADRCYYAAAQNGQTVRQGCMMGGNIYRDEATKVMTDLQTRFQFFQGQDGRMLILTSAGWMDGQAYVAQVAAANQAKAQASNNPSVTSYATGIVGGTYVGTGSMTLGPLPESSGYPAIDALRLKAMTGQAWNVPDNIVYVRSR